MRNLITIISLTIAVILGSAGCTHSENIIQIEGTGTGSNPCPNVFLRGTSKNIMRTVPNRLPSSWHNCSGNATRTVFDAVGEGYVFTSATNWHYGKPSGEVFERMGVGGDPRFETHEWTGVSGVRHGSYVRRTHTGSVMQSKHYTHGRESSPEERVASTRESRSQSRLSAIDDKKKECEAIGFKSGTEKFSDCVLRLIESDSKTSGSSVPVVTQRNSTGNTAVNSLINEQRALIKEQRRQQQLNSSMELIRRGADMMRSPTPSPAFPSPTTKCTVYNNGWNNPTLTCR